MRYLYLMLFYLLLLFTACAQDKSPAVSNGTLIFQSGFEPDSKVVPSGAEADIIGTDHSLADHNDWIADLSH